MQTLLAQGYEGKINLIYIDPPFWTGENYYASFVIEGESVTKSPSVIERLAYKDIWVGGIDSFLDMLYPRLQLMKRLLADNGSIYVHCDWHCGHYVKVMMDEVFGKGGTEGGKSVPGFRNEIIWHYATGGAGKEEYAKKHDNILYYAKSGKYKFYPERIKIIGSDFSKVAIQIIRNRLVNQDAKPFLIENIGNYQRQMIYLHGARIYEMQRIILKLYGATPRKDFSDMGMKKAEDGVTELVWVSYPDRPVPAKKVEELARRADHLDGRGFKRLVILGWDYEYNYNELLAARKRAEADKWNVQVVSKNIPPEVYEYLKKAKSEEEIEPLKEKIFFHEKPYLKVLKPMIEASSDKAKVTVGIDKYVLFDIPIEKKKERLKVRAIARDNFAALLDYWAVDWDYDGLTFKSEWQAFRGFGKNVKTVPTKTSKELGRGRGYSIAIRVVDIFGNDATAVVDVDLRGV